MLSSYNQTDSLQNFLGFDDGTLHTAPYTTPTEETFWQKYDNFTSDALVSVEETNNNFEMAHTEVKNKIVDTYETVKQSLSDTADTISNGMSISKNVIIASGILIISIGAWKLIGKDIYYITKGK